MTGVSAVLLTAGIGSAGLAFASDGVEAAAPDAVATGAEPQVVIVQKVARETVLRPLRDEKSRLSAKGADLWKISELGSFDVPSAAVAAYKHAAATVNAADPGCQMPWTLLAGIGRVESDHGRYGGSQLGSDGLPRPAIVGIPLNGAGPVAAIRDSDHGRWDGDKVWDRAVGPMQFIPSTWQGMARDGDGDGVANPNDIDDAALATAYYLCPSSGSVLPEATMRSEIYSYNHSDYYVDLVMAFEKGYRTGSFVIPSPPPPPEAAAPHADKPKKDKPKKDKPTKPTHPAHPTHPTHPTHPSTPPGSGGNAGGSHGNGGHHGGGGNGNGGNGGTHPTPSPSPTPTPPPAPTQFSGNLAACGPTWCVAGQALEWGNVDAPAKFDFDGNGTVGTNREELTGLQGSSVVATSSRAPRWSPRSAPTPTETPPGAVRRTAVRRPRSRAPRPEVRRRVPTRCAGGTP